MPSYVVCNHLSAQFLTKPFLPFMSAGIPFYQQDAYVGVPEPESGEGSSTARILHAPSSQLMKGTQLVRQAVSDLSQEGFDIDYVELSGVPHQHVLEELRKCDFIVEQVFSDLPIAGFGTEAAWFGKPAIVGGYAKKYLADDQISSTHLPPSLYCCPSQLKENIKTLIVDPEYRN
ncbi:hypothetical protein HC928_10625, partial [bacterium]|nr:hypothetical protein [bacterium]